MFCDPCEDDHFSGSLASSSTSTVIVDVGANSSISPSSAAPEEFHTLMTWCEASVALFNMLFGTVIYSIPYMFATSGLAVMCICVLVSAVSVYSCILLIRAVERVKVNSPSEAQRPTYFDVAKASFPKGSHFVGLVFFGEIMSYLFVNLIALGDVLSGTLPGGTLGTLMICATLGVVLSTIPDKAYSYVTLLSCGGNFMTCVVVIVSGSSLPRWADNIHIITVPTSAASSTGALVYAMAIHACLPTVLHSVQSPVAMYRATFVAYGLSTFLYCFFGILCYIMFGRATQVMVSKNVGFDLDMNPLPGLDVLVPLATIGVCMKTQLTLVQLSRPLAELLGKVCGLPMRRGNGGILCAFLTMPILYGSALGAFAFRNYLILVEDVSGSVLMSMTAFIFPGVLCLCACGPSAVTERRGAFMVIVCGVVVCVSSLTSA